MTKMTGEKQIMAKIGTIIASFVSEIGGHRMVWRRNLVLWRFGESASEENRSDPNEEKVSINY
jgi:hypothetical protein